MKPPLDQIEICQDHKIVDLWMSEYAYAAITASIELEVFDALADGPKSIVALAKDLKLGEEPLLRVARALVASEFFEIDSTEFNVFSLSEMSRIYFTRKSPLYRGEEFSPQLETKAHIRLVEMLEDGWSPVGADGKSFTEMWEKGSLSNEAATNFTAAMHSLIFAPALAAARSGVFSETKHLLDIAGGSGAFCMAFLSENPESKATLMELPQVCESSKEYFAKHEYSEKIETFPCNFFKDLWPDFHDGCLFSNILHDWPVEKCRQLLAKAFESLPPGGKIYIHEALLDEGRISPKSTVVFDLLMYMNHRAQQFTEIGLFQLLKEAGFEQMKTAHSFGYYSLVVASRTNKA